MHVKNEKRPEYTFGYYQLLCPLHLNESKKTGYNTN